MKRLQQLRDERKRLTDQASALMGAAESENRSLTEAEQKDFDGACARCQAIDVEVRNLERLEALDGSAGRRAPDGDGETRTVVQHSDTGEERNFLEEARRDRVFGRQVRTKLFRSEPDQHARQVKAYRSGRFLAAAIYGHGPSIRWCRDNGISLRNDPDPEERSLTTGSPTSAGVLVLDEYAAEIIDLKDEVGAFARFATRQPMSSGLRNQPVRTGGVTVYYPGEGGTLTESQNTFGNVQLKAKKAAILTKITSELEEDSFVSLADVLAAEFAYALALAEDNAGFSGDGSPTYGHITGAKTALQAGSRVTAATGNTAWSTLDLDDFRGMVAKLPEYAGMSALGGGPRWFISKPAYVDSMLRLMLASGIATATDIARGLVMEFMGYPVEIVPSLNSTLSTQANATGVCYFGNLAMAALLGVRRDVTIARSNDIYFAEDMIALRATYRHDIAIHSVGTATAAGALITLDLPAS